MSSPPNSKPPQVGRFGREIKKPYLRSSRRYSPASPSSSASPFSPPSLDSAMSDPPKSSSQLFGQPTSSGSSSGLFGQGTSNTSNPAGSLFGSNPLGSSATTLFGTTSTAGNNSSVFGSNAVGSGNSTLFGGGNKQSSGWSFGQPPSNNSSGGAISSGQSGLQGTQPSLTTAPSTSIFSTPNKPVEQPATSQNSTSNLFGGGASTGSSFQFKNMGSSASTSGQVASTTPTSKPTSNLFGNSTTPAGPPPTTNMGSSNTSVLFGNTSQDTANPFASLGQTTSTQQPTTSTTAASGGFSDFSLGSGKLQHPPATTSTLFSGFSTGASKPPESPATTSNAQPASIFSSTPNAGGSNLFGSKGGAESTGSLFSNLNKTQDPGATKSNGPQQPQNEISKTSNMFGPGAQLSTKSSTPQTTSASLFGGVASPSATPSAFNSLGKSASSGIATPSTSAPPGGLGDTFTSFGKPAEKASTTGAQSAGTSAPSLMGPPATSNVFGNLGKTAPPATSSLFGDVGKPATSSANSQAPAQPGTSQNLGGANANLGASTAGPAPTAQSRLKNKSMDEIITRWASDLSKYQKEFQQQAEKVAAWDRMLVDNSEKIQRLYGATLEAERATTEVERQLTAVENDQEELSMWLDHYEKDVDAMISNSVGQGDSLSGPDQERERTYQLANKLSERLDDMGKDLGNMIEEINDASSTLSKHSKADDPLTQVVRVLNSHLTQLQQIDQGTAALTLKVKEAQRAGQSMGPSTGLRGPTSDAADGFYRSFMGRR